MIQKELQDYKSSGVECPTCGRDDFKNEHGMKIHHSRSHGEEIGGVKTDCDWCGETFRQRPYKVEKNKHSFCTRECMGKWQSENLVGENGTNHKGGRHVECRNCGGEFWATPHQFSDDYPKQNPTYCSNKCHHQDLQTRYAGEENPRYEGGPFSKGPGWGYTKSREVRIRDRATCVDCGRTKKEVVESGGGYLHVHHICGARESTNPAVYNAVRNLVTLCSKCHTRWERHVPGVPPDITQNYDNHRVSIE